MWEEGEGAGRLTVEQEVELAEPRSKVAGRKQDQDVTETGVGVSGWTETDLDDWDGWSADVDLDAWLDWAVADVGGVQVPQGAADAGVIRSWRGGGS